MTGQQSAVSRLPEWTIMYALHDAFRRDLDALATTSASPAAVRARWAIFRDQLEFHHTAEDQVMWPPVRARLAGDPDGLALMEAMEDEHSQMTRYWPRPATRLRTEPARPGSAARCPGCAPPWPATSPTKKPAPSR